MAARTLGGQDTISGAGVFVEGLKWFSRSKVAGRNAWDGRPGLQTGFMGEIEGEGWGIGPCRISRIELHSEINSVERSR